MTIKRLILIFLTVFAVLKVLLSLGESFNEPQVQSRVELYQTELLLHAAELPASALFQEDVAESGTRVLAPFIGEDPYRNAQNQYQNAQEVAQRTHQTLENQLQQLSAALVLETQEHEINSPQTLSVKASAISQQQEQIQEEMEALDKFVDEVALKLGILQAQKGEIEEALNTWNPLEEGTSNRQPEIKTVETARILQGLWEETPRLYPNAESYIQQNLEGWFRYRSLKQLYQLQQRQDAVLALQSEEELLAKEALGKLAVISGIPLLGGILGVGILLFLLIQWIFLRERSLLANGGELTWETPWNGEITWQVIIIGFFFVGQFLLPILFAVSGFAPTGLSLRETATYILMSYLLMTLGGLLVLYLSIKPFFPLPKDWFQVNIFSRWILWGFGGYWVALPVVVLVSLINQQIWNGNGGSNPIIFLALQAQDTLALGIFFFTASIAAPIFEEIIFRGFLLPSLTRYFPAWGAIVLSSLLFSVAHLSLSEVLPLTALGLILGFVYTRSRNLLSSILLHSLWNSGTLLSLFVLGSGVG